VWFALSALHLIIGVHSPLEIDIVEHRNGRSIRGVTFRESRPGRRYCDTFRVNANETPRMASFRTKVMHPPHQCPARSPVSGVSADLGFALKPHKM